MTKPFSISLKSGERIYINGAVVRVDRKVSIEFLNDVAFLLEAHVMQPDQTTTPFRQLYFIVQTMLMDPADTAAARQLFDSVHANLCNALTCPELLAAHWRCGGSSMPNGTSSALRRCAAASPRRRKFSGAPTATVNKVSDRSAEMTISAIDTTTAANATATSST